MKAGKNNGIALKKLRENRERGREREDHILFDDNGLEMDKTGGNIVIMKLLQYSKGKGNISCPNLDN